MLAECRGVRRPIRRNTLERIRQMDRFQPGFVERSALGAQRMVARSS
jgi:hypothetical protein